MKQLTNLLLGFTLVALTFIGCRRYDDTFIKGEITRLDKRITSLEERVNTNISSVTTMVEALQDNDYIVSTEEYFENGVQVGYKIVFKKQKPIIIFFGKDGTNGSNGTDGHTPQIGVRQDSDGLWYWTVDGQWLLNADKEKVRASARDGRDGTDGHTYSIAAVRAEDNLLYWQIDGSWLLDDEGNKVRAEGVDGSSGADGHSPSIDVRQDEDGLWYWTIDGQWLLNSEQKKVRAVGIDGKDGLNGGADGKDGITPQLKIEDGCWMVSTDKGLTWTNIGSATGAAGKDGDSFFSSVDTSNEDRVVITMADGTEFSFPTWASFETLQNTVNEVNTYVNSVKTIIEAADAGDYVTSTAPYMENGEQVGYQINFAKGDPLVIYNGKDGAAGKDGYTPRVGVKKNDDNLWYWTIDGEWLTDEQGNKVKAVGTDGKDGVDGTDGTNGTNGNNGTDGVTPQLKIEDNYWYVSTDKGQTWTRLGKATGEDGQDGAPGKDGDSFFSSVDTSNEDCVVITMADGTEFSFPTWTVFQTLQNTVNQINQNISSYQTIIEALQESDYVVSTSPYLENGKQVGYQINFAQSGPLVIYNGKDGKDGLNGTNGTNGTNGHTPQIGVSQDQSGTYYWTVDGEWLLDEQGNKVKAVGTDGKDGVDGTDGTNGTNGNNGTDGVTPQLKIEDNYWYVSTDKGQTWTRLGKATGEDGAAGKDGDSFFNSVDTSNEDCVVITMADGTEFSFPTWTVFQTLQNTVNQINQNISSYQTIIEALQESDYVVSTSPYLENGKQVGYQINFAQSGPLVIYNGKDGKDGVNGSNGTNGHTPKIGVSQDQSGTYYWTVDGEWLTDEQGNKVKAVGKDGKDGVDGTDGTNGTNGNNGTDGVTPQLKIENSYWYVSTDKGQTWTQLGKATGEDGQDGAPGKDGDSFFQSLTQDDNNVYLTLSDQTILTLPKSSTLDISFTNADNLALQTGVSKTIGYAVTSSVKPVTVEVVTSADIRAKVISGDNTGTSGSITIVAKDAIDEYSQIIVFVSNGQKVITRTFTPTDGGTLIRTSDARVRVPAEGGVVDISFLSSVEYEVIIPQEAQSWISLAPKTRVVEYTESLIITSNPRAERSAEIKVKGINSELFITYLIFQNSEIPSPNAVDLGLSVKWADCNVGASRPEEFGNLYAWGETYTKATFSAATYKWTKNGSSPTIGVIDSENDVATCYFGDGWRIPTEAEAAELVNRSNCSWEEATINGVSGHVVTSLRNGNSIFIPWVPSVTDQGRYWTSTYSSTSPHGSARVWGSTTNMTRTYCYNGLPIRPVKD